MNTNAKYSKASKGTVKVKNSNDRLQLVFSYGGKRHYLSTGFTDTDSHRKLAEMKARQIELDILSGNFDPTLEKYKPPKVELVTPIFTPILEAAEAEPEAIGPLLGDLWERYTEFKRPSLSPSTLAKDFQKTERCITNLLPTQRLVEAVAIRDWLVANKTPNATKRLLTQFSACCEWAVKSALIDSNPFTGMAADIKQPKAETEETDIHPFSLEERDRIIEAFQIDRYYSRYAKLVEFLFMTGCRPSEAIALQWKHILDGGKSIRFEQAVVISTKGLVCKKGLKTQKKRVFPANSKLTHCLKSLRPSKVTGEELVFPSPEGTWIDMHNFTARAWKSVLEKLTDIEYRKLYQTRHTFITHALEHGMDVKDVARLVGNSPEVIYRHYAGKSRELRVPEF
jgi:integrase